MKSKASKKWEPALSSASEVPASRLEVGIRLAKLADRFESRKNAAEIAGVSTDQLKLYLDGKSKPPFEVVARLARHKGVTLDWVATGHGPMEGSGQLEDDLGGQKPIQVDDYTFLPRYDAHVAAGAAALTDSSQIVDHLAFKTSWIRNELRLDPKHLLLIQAFGDSMHPTIRDRDLLLVWTAVREVLDGAIYAVEFEGGLQVKRLQRRQGGIVRMKSDNTLYDAVDLEPHDAARLRVIGQVVWHGGRL
jgi:phage repressor protein C with HTH and peptisase S24 domain